MISIGRLDIPELKIISEDDRSFVFFPKNTPMEKIAGAIIEDITPDVIHMHGSHLWPSYPYYAKTFVREVDKLIFSPAGSSCGTPEFLTYFDHIIVNHPLQVDRMKVYPYDKYKIIIRKRSADPSVFYPNFSEDILYDFVYVAGFVPVKQIPEMIKLVMNTKRKLLVLGDFSRTRNHYLQIKNLIDDFHFEDQIILHDFIPQTEMADLLGQCGVFVWPNIRPENPSTTTNRAVIEALACGMPLLLGRKAFNETEFVIPGRNGFLYDNENSFIEFSEKIFDNINLYRYFSNELIKERFSFQENFIDFYNYLYSS